MVKNHLKRIATPKTWNILRKEHTFITKPNTGAHTRYMSTSINTLIKEELKLATTKKEVKNILHNKLCLVNGKTIHDERYNVGFMDVISFTKTNQHYRLLLDAKGRLAATSIPEDEKTTKLVRINGKSTAPKGKEQLTTSDGRTFITSTKNYKVGDTLLIEIPQQTIKEHYSFGAQKSAIILKGRHAGAQGIIQSVEEDIVQIKTHDDEVLTTKKEYSFITGESKPLITCTP